MGDCFINIRFWMWHFQVRKTKPKWIGISSNKYHLKNWIIFGFYDFKPIQLYKCWKNNQWDITADGTR